MSAGIGDKFKNAFNSGNPNVARVSSTRTTGGTTLACDNLAGWPTATAVDFSTYKLNTSNAVIPGTQIDWKGIVSGNNIGTLTRITGASDAGSAIGDVVEMNPTGNWATDLTNGILVQHKQDGTHGAITATSVASAGAVSGTTGTFTSGITLTGQISTGGLLKQSVIFTSSGTYTKPTGINFIVVEVVGGGGSGAGVTSTGSSANAVGSGGGAGGYARTKIVAASISTTTTVTIGTGGAAASGSSNAGTSTSFGIQAVATGGSGGSLVLGTTTNGSFANGVVGGIGTTGDLLIPGGSGGSGLTDPSNSNVALAGKGGDSHFGAGGYATAANTAGNTGLGYGAGGSGAAHGSSQSAASGGAGTNGIVIVNEYY